MERSFNVLDSAAENEGSGMIGAAVGLGAGVGVGSQIGAMVNEHINTNPTTIPPTMPVSQYFLGVNGQQQGPFDFEAVKNMLTSHQINETVLIWKRGMANWMLIRDLPEFSDVLNNCPPPLPTM